MPRPQGLPWGGGADQLTSVGNKGDLAGLVVLDTWIRNRDRYSISGTQVRRNPDNVWLSRHGRGRHNLVVTAIDHTHCFGYTLQFTTALSNISAVKDDRVFGLFPAFQGHFDKGALQVACDRLSRMSHDRIDPVVDSIPNKWEVGSPVREAWIDLLVQRADYVATSLVSKVFP